MDDAQHSPVFQTIIKQRKKNPYRADVVRPNKADDGSQQSSVLHLNKLDLWKDAEHLTRLGKIGKQFLK